jgi:hypothetical protein
VVLRRSRLDGVQNERVPSPLRSPLSLAVLTTVTALTLAGCGGGDSAGKAAKGNASASSSSSSSGSSPSASSTVKVPDGVDLTKQGAELSFGDTGTVIFEAAQGRGSVLQLTVKGVQQGTLSDFKGFILDDAYKQKASYYYATVQVKNVGEGDVGGVGVPLWGVNASNTLLPAVNFTTGFAKCPTKPLPAKFGPGATLDTCLVYLSPDRGSLDAVSYRPTQEFDPITWTGQISKPTPAPSTKATPKKKKKKG